MVFPSFSKLLSFAIVYELLFTAATAVDGTSLAPKHLLNRSSNSTATDSTEVTYTSHVVELPIDHFGGDVGTFRNRYWVRSDWYRPGGPVVLMDVGEMPADPQGGDLTKLVGMNAAIHFGGLLIQWEHRYYGNSLPLLNFDPAKLVTDESDNSLADWYKYLTVDQALEDVVAFASNFSYAALPDHDLTAGSTQWIFTGGSYSGARTAWIRERNPDVIFISEAGSAPINVQIDFRWYTDAITTYMEKHGYVNCTRDLHAFWSWSNDIVNTNDSAEFQTFATLVNTHLDNSTIAAADVLDTWLGFLRGDFQYVGMGPRKDKTASIGYFCDALHSTSDSQQASESGIFATYNKKIALEKMAKALAEVFTYNAKVNGISSVDNSLSDCASGDLTACPSYLYKANMGWVWQTCRELGLLQITDDSDPMSPFPTWTNLTWFLQKCLTSGLPDLEPKKYGQFAELNPSNTFFVDGQWDPWRQLSLNSPHSGRTATAQIPKANEKLKDGQFFGAVVEDLFHDPLNAFPGTLAKPGANSSTIIDITGSEEALETALKKTGGTLYFGLNAVTSALKAQELFLEAVAEWLPCFEKHKLSTRPVTTTAKAVPGYFTCSDSVNAMALGSNIDCSLAAAAAAANSTMRGNSTTSTKSGNRTLVTSNTAISQETGSGASALLAIPATYLVLVESFFVFFV